MKLFYYIRTHKYKVLMAVSMMFFLSLIQSFFPFINKILIDDVFGDKQYDILPKLILGVFIAAILFFILSITKELFVTYISQRITIEIKNDLTKHIRRLPFPSFRNKSVGEYLSIFQSDISLVTNVYTTILPNMIEIILQLLISSTILILLNYKLLILVAILIPINLGVNYLFLKPINKLSLKTQEIVSAVTDKTKESLTNTKEIIGFSQKDWDIKRLNKINLELLPVQMKRTLISASSSNINFMIYWIAFIIIVYFGGKQVQNGSMSLGTLVVFITYLMTLFGPISALLSLNVELQRCIGGAKRISDLFETEKEKESLNRIELGSLFPIQLRNVSYSFDGKSVLKNINFEVKKGETIALIGKSGEGKSTLINILLGLYSPESGSVTVKGKNIAQLNSKSYLENLAVVFQESNLFSGTIEENIRFSNFYANEDDIIHAAMSASAHEFIDALPEGYKTVLGEKYVNLSGGQKQRIAIARALLKKPQLLILDEATSSLDYKTQEKINFSIEPEQATLIVTHRLESLKGVDKVFIVNNGQVTQYSTYEEAIKYSNDT